ncbi:DUF427 domain-containing protein [Duganella hordei]|uniref:DUF427 domain-containing protein n=1 Tax=Duganella hordei TaxID=2865934 RepID=UPI0033414593
MTTQRTVKIPGPDHPITIEATPGRVRVVVAGKALSDSGNALTLREAAYPPVQYLPRTDVDMSQLQRSEHTTYCPYKGECSYYSVPAGGEAGINAVWTYEAPYPAVVGIAGHLAFYPDRVELILIDG